MQELDEQRRPRDARLESRLSVNQMTFAGTTFENDVQTCRDVGILGLGVEAGKLEDGRDEEFAELLAAADIQATLCVPDSPSILPVALFGGSQDPRVRLGEMIASIRRFERFRPSQFITLTGVGGTGDDSEQRRTVVEGYRRLGAAAADVGALVGIEPIRARFAPDSSIVSSVEEAANLIDEIGAPNVGIIYDVWHHFDSPTLLADIESYSSLFTIVQLGDAPRGADHGINRSIPGEGVVPFEAILGALERAGYTGWLDVELLSDPDIPSPIPADLSPREVVTRAKAGIERAWPPKPPSR
jgi:sugar phosphate isomerase/epimerase